MKFILYIFLIFPTSLHAGLKDWISGASTWEEPANIRKLSPQAKELVESALKNVPGIVDTHLHLICKEAKNSCYVPEKLFSPLSHPIKTFKSHILMSALGVQDENDSDADFLKRLEKLVEQFPSKPYVAMVFAYSATYDRDTQEKLLDKTGLEVSNSYLSQVVAKNPQSFIPVYSLHPFQPDLQKQFAALNKPRFFKVLPNSMHFSPDDEKCAPFFQLLAKNNSVLITHVGDEHSVDGGGIDNTLGKPLLYEKWLKRYPNLKIIFAHTGGAGKSSVEDKREDNFELVLQLMRKYPQQTYSDISAFSLAPNLVKHIPKLLEQTDLHSRMFYGSDYPLVAIKPLISTSLFLMYAKGLLGNWKTFNARYNAIIEIYNYNPLLASFVIMRLFTYNGKQLPNEVFFENAWRLIGESFDFSRTRMGVPL